MLEFCEINLYIESQRYEALKKTLLEATGESLDDKMEEAFGDLYREYVPDDQRATIEAEIAEAKAQAEAESEAARRFAVFHVREKGEDHLFRSEVFTTPIAVAYRYRLYQRGELSSEPRIFAEGLGLVEPMTDKEYAAACDDINSDNRITAIMELDLDGGTVSICDSSDNAWNAYRLHDFSVAAYKAYRSEYRASDSRREIFNHSLIGKEIVFDDDNEETPTEDDGEDEAPTMQM